MTTSGALFPSLVPGSRGSSTKYLVEFRAGKMSLKGTTVTPDKRKGLVYIQQTDDSLIHFCWKDRTSGTVEDDLIIFPDDCEFKRVPQCPSGRVYVLKFKAGSKRLFFWMQVGLEPSLDQAWPACWGAAGLRQAALRPAASTTSPSPAPSSGNGTSTAASPTQPIQLSDLQNILATMNVPAGPGGSQQVDLASVLTPEIMAPILANADVQERLLPYLPSGESLPQTADEIQNTLTSPQFQQALGMFSAALASGQLGPLMCQFGLPAEAVEAANKGDVEAFAKAMQNNAKPEPKEGDAKDKKDEEEDMSLD
ncbi:proteasomal ubiquitin receptor ADRM1-like protein [Cricetulus griseus]|uniref:Proteasomal ubiquitin receptor ADRM1 n=1 Tax=Cricetulus griseus TaxID=10029 RepID=A0A8C2LLE1_CRIGR|nr:proteasomal ubiquitin receptor ADRM1-like protein [Cricetulus griseus]